MKFSEPMRNALRMQIESVLYFGEYTATKVAEQGRHTVVFLRNEELIQVNGDNDGPNPFLFTLTGDFENFYINDDGVMPTPEQVANAISHETLHLVFERLWREDRNEVELMIMSSNIDSLNELAFHYGLVEYMPLSDNKRAVTVAQLDNTGLPYNLERLFRFFREDHKVNTDSYGMYG